MASVDYLRRRLALLDAEIERIIASFDEQDNVAYAIYVRRMSNLRSKNENEKEHHRRAMRHMNEYLSVRSGAMAAASPQLNERARLWTELKEAEYQERKRARRNKA